MKNLLVIAVTVGLGYLGWDALQPPPAPPPRIVARATPAPSAAPKLYFHSALDAPAMRPYEHTGTSYFSTDSGSQFYAGYSSSGYGSAGTYVGPGSTIIVAPASRAATSTSSALGGLQAAQAASAPARPFPFYFRQDATKTTPNPVGVAR